MSDFILPDIGEGIVECELVKWLVSEGDLIEEDQPVAEVMTDKALVEIPAPYKGRVTRLYHKEGDIAKVHAPLFELVGEDDESGSSGSAKPEAKEPEQAPVAAAKPDTAANQGDDATEDFILPDIGEGIVECEVVEWRVAEGDEIEEDQPVVDVMTDKAMVEITAPKAGRVTKLYHQQQQMAQVHSPLFAFVPRERDEPVESKAQPSQAPAQDSAPAAAQPAAVQNRQRIPASPAVRRMVREHSLNLADINGSGKDGRVLKADVLAHLDKPAAKPESESTSAEAKPTPAGSRRQATGEQEVRVEPIKGMKAAMARNMVTSATTIPHFIYSEEIDVTDLLALREKLKVEAEAKGSRLTLMPFFMKAMALAVQEFPVLNSRINDDVSEIHYLSQCNIGMAVDGKAGLMVPNVKGVESLTMLGVADEVARLTEAARSGRVSQDDLKGGTITISNIGALGGTYASPIINAPEVAIVALGRTQKLPRFDASGQVVERAIMTVSWAGDHRIIDGGTIARFCNRWKSYLESPQSMLLHMG